MKTLKPKPEYAPQERPDPNRFDFFPRPQYTTWVTLTCTEVTSLCPITQQPDYARVTISYYPIDQCLETKSLKEYLLGYRNFGNFCEAMADRIINDLYPRLKPKQLDVDVEFTSRGGIIIHSRASRREYDTVQL